MEEVHGQLPEGIVDRCIADYQEVQLTLKRHTQQNSAVVNINNNDNECITTAQKLLQ